MTIKLILILIYQWPEFQSCRYGHLSIFNHPGQFSPICVHTILQASCHGAKPDGKVEAVSHLVNVDGDSDDDVQQVTECQAADQNVGSIAHALVLVDDPQQGGVADDAHHKHQARHHRVDVLEGVPDFRGSGAHWWQPAARHANVGPYKTLHVPLHQPGLLRCTRKVHRRFVLLLLLPAGHRHVARQEDERQAHKLSLHPGVCLEIWSLSTGDNEQQRMRCEIVELFIHHTVYRDITVSCCKIWCLTQ